MLKAMKKDRERFTPKTGFNLVGVDDFERPGEQLYLIDHFPDRDAAEKALAARKKVRPREKVYIYGPDTT